MMKWGSKVQNLKKIYCCDKKLHQVLVVTLNVSQYYPLVTKVIGMFLSRYNV